ncbi:dihydroorotate dehydrogenase [Lucifera butyrica]|uniref:dihydrouracil dehydrogenase (NAD(+)) n=1 Tax=Lucifera butyrica TaxID=1351585 RepID=A0A498R701_9FIRM|nr:NAD-dependent dihydropyrimidine dehydrogenase subunit PreA [Lucifera butyrica]VBB07274.1 dihydroorotate dehydrogenase [Lucifera butyrica]
MDTDSINRNEADVSVTIGGLHLENPFILASAPPTSDGNFIRKAFQMGWGGAVIKTIKPDEMEISDVSPRFGVLKDKQGQNIGFENFELVSKKNCDYWVEEIRAIKKEYPAKVLIASIMADVSLKSWKNLAFKMERAGADALELNFSCPHGMPEKGIGSAIGQSAEIAAMITKWVKEAVNLPVIVKLTPNVTDIAAIARQVAAAGADAIAAINTVQCLMGVDLDTLSPLPAVNGYSTYGGYSGYAVKPVGLRCVAQIANAVELPVYGIGGVGTWQDAIEYIAVGASAVQICTAAMLEGFQIIQPMLAGLKSYMQEKEIKKLADICGIAAKKMTSHTNLSREYAAKAFLANPAECTFCRKCLVACNESAYGAIQARGRQIQIDESKCDGCSLCSLVCPKQVIKMKAPYYRQGQELRNIV